MTPRRSLDLLKPYEAAEKYRRIRGIDVKNNLPLSVGGGGFYVLYNAGSACSYLNQVTSTPGVLVWSTTRNSCRSLDFYLFNLFVGALVGTGQTLVG
jgi:hypothetical protein